VIIIIIIIISSSSSSSSIIISIIIIIIISFFLPTCIKAAEWCSIPSHLPSLGITAHEQSEWWWLSASRLRLCTIANDQSECCSFCVACGAGEASGPPSRRKGGREARKVKKAAAREKVKA
jgi:hypothetical protein